MEAIVDGDEFMGFDEGVCQCGVPRLLRKPPIVPEAVRRATSSQSDLYFSIRLCLIVKPQKLSHAQAFWMSAACSA